MLANSEHPQNPLLIWTPGNAPPALKDGEAQFWSGPVDTAWESVSRWAQLLSEPERTQASRFRFDADRRRYSVSHGLLRLLLSAHLDQAPELIPFTCNAFGKPSVEAAINDRKVEFSLSHSGDMAAIGLALGQPVGIDIELARPDVDIEELARTICAPGELACLNRLAGPAREEAFFNCWTRKEAYIKARGEGLSYPLQKFEATIDSEKTFQVSDHAAGTSCSGWATRLTHAANWYPAAIIVLGEPVAVGHFGWTLPDYPPSSPTAA